MRLHEPKPTVAEVKHNELLDPNLLLDASVVLRQVSGDVPVPRSRVGEVKGPGALGDHRQSQRKRGAPQRGVRKQRACGVYDWRGAPADVAAKHRETFREQMRR